MQKKNSFTAFIACSSISSSSTYADEQVASEPSQEVAAATSAQKGMSQMELLIQSAQGEESASGKQSDLPEAKYYPYK